MDQSSKARQRTVLIACLPDDSSPSKDETKLPDELPALFAHLREIVLKKSQTRDGLDSSIIQCVEAINSKIRELTSPTEPTDVFDQLQASLKTYINDILSIKNCLNILSNDLLCGILNSLHSTESAIDLYSIFESNPLYARTVYNRSFDLLSLPCIIDFLNDKYPIEIFVTMSYTLRIILVRIQSTIDHIVFKKNDLQNQRAVLCLLIDYVDKHKENFDNLDMPGTVSSILSFFCCLVNDTILVPDVLETKCATYILQWIPNTDFLLDFILLCVHILHNIARHEQGAQILKGANAIKILRDFKQRIIDPNKNSTDEIHATLRLVYCMIISLLTEPKENREDLNDLQKILDQLIQLSIDCGQAENYKHGGFHVSEPIVVLTKLCVHDEILHYVLTKAKVENMQAKSVVNFFCQLLMKFRGALAGENDLDQLTLTALFNILWSISFHDQYIEELKANAKFLLTVKSLANDDGEAWVDQYVPKSMSSIPKAASGILWNLDEDNPARAARTEATPIDEKEIKTDNRTRVMISYCHADKDFCHQLVDGLQKEKSLEIWVDFAYCHTEDFWEEIGEAIEKAHVVLFLMSKDYQDSKSCRQEVLYAKDSLKKRFVPIYTKNDFTATGWLGVRIVGPQYVRFGKRPFEEQLQALIKLIMDDRKSEKTEPSTKPPPPQPPTPAVVNSTDAKDTVTDSKPSKNTNDSKNPTENEPSEELNIKLPRKPVEEWTKKEISQWFDANSIHRELIDLYDFRRGTDLLLYGQCLRPDWQIEYSDMRERYQKKHNSPLYRDQFVRFVSAVHHLKPSQASSKTCVVS